MECINVLSESSDIIILVTSDPVLVESDNSVIQPTNYYQPNPIQNQSQASFMDSEEELFNLGTDQLMKMKRKLSPMKHQPQQHPPLKQKKKLKIILMDSDDVNHSASVNPIV